jgi:3-oxoacyl-[acyl-carrier-protein] synthase-3
MSEPSSVGIHGTGVYLPPEVRKNQWWPASVIEGWRNRRGGQTTREAISDGDPGDIVPLTDGVRLILARLSDAKSDIFQGAEERRVMPAGMLSSDMEASAAREAIMASKVDPEDIDLLLTHSYCPDLLNVPNACIVHRKLGLQERCFTMSVDGASNSFLLQLALAEQMIASGRSRFALLVQSSASSRLIDASDPSSLWFGDGATAVVVGPVARGKGILGQSHHTDGTLSRTIVCGVPGREWYDEGRCILYMMDPLEGRRMILTIADYSKQAIHAALAQAKLRAEDVRFYASHQGTFWLRALTQEYTGLLGASSADTFAQTTSLVAANIPLLLAEGQRRGSLNDGDPVVLFSGGSGITWSAVVLRWGI